MNVGLTVFNVLEAIGVFAFALSGAITAIERELDVFGVIIMGLTTAMGGGVVRDMLIGKIPPSLFYSYEFVALALVVSLLTFLVGYIANKKKVDIDIDSVNFINNIFDAIGLGTFSVLGVSIAMESGYTENVFLCVSLGLLTGVGGGALRDVMSKSIPFIFNKRIYAVASIAGCLVFYYMELCSVSKILSVIAAITVTFALRMFATIFKWKLPKIKLNNKE